MNPVEELKRVIADFRAEVKTDLSEHRREAKEANEQLRASMESSNLRVHERIDQVGKRVDSTKRLAAIHTEQIAGLVPIVRDNKDEIDRLRETTSKQIERLRRSSSPAPEGPKSVRAAYAMSLLDWRKIGMLTGGLVVGLGGPTVVHDMLTGAETKERIDQLANKTEQNTEAVAEVMSIAADQTEVVARVVETDPLAEPEIIAEVRKKTNAIRKKAKRGTAKLRAAPEKKPGADASAPDAPGD